LKIQSIPPKYIGTENYDLVGIGAQKFGAHHTINSTKQDVIVVVDELTNSEGVSVAI
jgi:hypothetical protein